MIQFSSNALAGFFPQIFREARKLGLILPLIKLYPKHSWINSIREVFAYTISLVNKAEPWS